MQELQCLGFMLKGEMKIWREFEVGGKLERFHIIDMRFLKENSVGRIIGIADWLVIIYSQEKAPSFSRKSQGM